MAGPGRRGIGVRRIASGGGGGAGGVGGGGRRESVLTRRFWYAVMSRATTTLAKIKPPIIAKSRADILLDSLLEEVADGAVVVVLPMQTGYYDAHVRERQMRGDVRCGHSRHGRTLTRDVGDADAEKRKET
jgi:hypothetical protein